MAPPKSKAPSLPAWFSSYDRALPAALLALCREEKCSLCEVEFNGPSISQSHYHGKAHARKVAAYLDNDEDIPEGLKPKKVLKMEPGESGSNGLFCSTCGLLCTSQVVYDDHMKGKNHAAKVRAALQAANGELDAQHQCSVCHIFAATRDALQAHIDGKAHKKKVASLSLNKFDLRCDLCDVTSTDKDGHEKHLNGKRHKENMLGGVPSRLSKQEKKETTVIDYDTFTPKIVEESSNTKVQPLPHSGMEI